jgi:hypothetical protein
VYNNTDVVKTVTYNTTNIDAIDHIEVGGVTLKITPAAVLTVSNHQGGSYTKRYPNPSAKYPLDIPEP